MQIETH